MAEPRVHLITSLEQIHLCLPTLLGRSQCLLVLCRHWPHENNVLKRWAVRLARKIGVGFSGIKIGLVLSSPEPRAVETAIAFQSRRGQKPARIQTDDRLGALPGEMAAEIKKAAQAAGRAIEPFLLEEEGYQSLRQESGNRGAECVIDHLAQNLGQTILVTSHGGGKLEPMIASLTGREQKDYFYKMPMGSICLIIMDKDGNVLSEVYLEFDPLLVKGH